MTTKEPNESAAAIDSLLLAFRKAAVNDARTQQGKEPLEKAETERVHVWPHLVTVELIAAALSTIVLLVWSVLVPAPLEAPANPSHSPNPAKAPWYFLGLQELLVYFDPWIAGVLIPGTIIVGLMAIPYLDPNPKGNGYYTFRERRLAVTGFLFGFCILWILPIVIGTFLRGPNWSFFGPYETWDPHKIEPMVNVNLSEIIWIKLLGVGFPHRPAGSQFLGVMLREAVGIALIAAYFLLLPAAAAKKKLRGLYRELGPWKYAF